MAMIPRFGIEEEFFLCDLRTRAVVRRPSRAFGLESRRRLLDRVSSELLQSQVEVKTPILSSIESALESIASGRAALIEVASAHQMGVLSAGTHPLAEWRGQLPTEAVRYEKMFDDFQIIAQRNLLCGLHVHVEVPTSIDRIQLMNGVMRWLPFLLALSASSPYWARQDTGLMSYRQSAYDEWPRTGIPRLFRDEAEYRRYVDALRKARAIKDESFIWWALRPSSRFPTVELRITDACPLIEDVLCIAELFRVIVHQQTQAMLRNPQVERDDIARLLIEENRWRAKRFGEQASFIDLSTSENLSALQCLDSLVRENADAIAELRAERAVERARRVIVEGSSATRQRRTYALARASGLAHRHALVQVTDTLLSETRRLD
jgi:carboxylate-amine ligase